MASAAVSKAVARIIKAAKLNPLRWAVSRENSSWYKISWGVDIAVVSAKTDISLSKTRTGSSNTEFCSFASGRIFFPFRIM